MDILSVVGRYFVESRNRRNDLDDSNNLLVQVYHILKKGSKINFKINYGNRSPIRNYHSLCKSLNLIIELRYSNEARSHRGHRNSGRGGGGTEISFALICAPESLEKNNKRIYWVFTIE
jgi:hypothetical protein